MRFHLIKSQYIDVPKQFQFFRVWCMYALLLPLIFDFVWKNSRFRLRFTFVNPTVWTKWMEFYVIMFGSCWNPRLFSFCFIFLFHLLVKGNNLLLNRFIFSVIMCVYSVFYHFLFCPLLFHCLFIKNTLILLQNAVKIRMTSF